jgi:hypothetical protein
MTTIRKHVARHLAIRVLQRDRHQLFLQTSLFVSRIRRLLGSQRKLVLHLTRDLLLRAI